jgi:septal ring factor EnvC (AmiA/AmiB activator)
MQTRRLWLPAACLATLALAVVLVGEASSHDIYNPARTALVNAERQLSETAREEQDILERLQRMHGELDSALQLLASAEQLDPAMQAPIADVRERLAALQDKPSLCPQDSSSAVVTYQQLLGDVQALIEHY